MAQMTYHNVGEYPLGSDVNPNLYDLLSNQETELVGSITSTQVLYQMTNGLMLRITGSGFTADAEGDLADTGTMTGFDILLGDGATVLVSIDLNLSMETFYDASIALNPNDLAAFILNGADTITGSDADDDIRGFAGNDIINAGDGDADYVDGGEGVDTFDGGAGSADQLVFASAYGSSSAYRGILLNAVTGTVIDPWGNSETFSNFESFRGCQFADSMTGSSLDESFMGLGGADFIDGGAGFDIVRYHRDADRGGFRGVTVNLNSDTAIDGFGRTDTIVNIEGARGTAFADTFVGDAQDNRFQGDAGNDVLNGGGGADYLAGGAGDDTYVIDDINDQVIEANGNGTDVVRSSISHSLAGFVENLVLTGTAAVNGTGNNLNNTITGNAAANQLNGGDGNDTMNGGGGADTLNGGGGNDTYVLGSQNATIIDSGGVDLITCSISRSIGSLSFIENMALTGNAAINGIGNNLANVIAGNSAANLLNGAAGNDSLNGNLGNDTLTGGVGQDTFLFNSTLNASTNVDAITDFTVVDDTIRLENGIFTALVSTGTLSASLFASNTTGQAGDANDRIIYESDTGWLYYDSNGSAAGGSVHFATLTTGLALTANDFFVV